MSAWKRATDIGANWIATWSKRFSRFRLYSGLGRAVRSQLLGEESGLILNIGAGGEVENTLKRLGVRMTTIDIDPGRGPDLVMDVQNMERLADGSVRAAVMLEVLEHVRQPQKAVEELQRVLLSGGLVIGSTPFILGIHDAPHDYYRFTRHGLMHLFREFDCVELTERGGYFRAVATLLMRWLKQAADRRSLGVVVALPVLLPLALAFVMLDGLVPNVSATTGYFFVFRKR